MIVIIGGGLSGLTCALELERANVPYLLLEATDRVGGRVKTDTVDGYRLDRGFQVLLTAYPETQLFLDYAALDLKTFLPGALLLIDQGNVDRIGDPFRDPTSLWPTLTAKAGSLSDKLKILKLRNQVSGTSIAQLFDRQEQPTRVTLREEYGFSDRMIQRFFQPFYAGIFLERELTTSRRMFDFAFKMFAKGTAAVPNRGMEEIPKQLLSKLNPTSVRTHARVRHFKQGLVELENGEEINAEAIVLAVEATSALWKPYRKEAPRYESTVNLHFVAPEDPIGKPIIALNAHLNPNRLVNNLCTITTVAPGYGVSSTGQHLISVSIVGVPPIPEDELPGRVREELSFWYDTSAWRHLRTQRVQYALPNQTHVRHARRHEDYRLDDGVYVCGDHLLNGSINAAMRSGRRVGELIRLKRAK